MAAQARVCLRRTLSVVVWGWLAGIAEAQAPPQFTPWIYHESGELVWGRHQFYEDTGNSVFAVARDLVEVPGQIGEHEGPYEEVIVLNFAQFEPPEGMPCEPGQRRILRESLEMKGLQLYVNYSDSPVVPGGPSYFLPTFFISTGDGHRQNTQPTPAVPGFGFEGSQASATRAAFGRVLPEDPPSGSSTEPALINDEVNALYVTASVRYGLDDFFPDDRSLAENARTDQFFVRRANRWVNMFSERINSVAAQEGNSSGVIFTDLDGDGDDDLYIGKTGDNYRGSKNVLLLNDGSGVFNDETDQRIERRAFTATNDVAAHDVNQDGYIDLIVANRCSRELDAAGDIVPCGPESRDYVLLNTGDRFQNGMTPHLFEGPYFLDLDANSDSRSVAVGDLDHVNDDEKFYPEIVIGNAGTDGFSNEFDVERDGPNPHPDNHEMEIFRLEGFDQGTPIFVDRMIDFLDPQDEWKFTSPFTQQVVLADLFDANYVDPQDPGLAGYGADGWLDLLVVNHRDILKNRRVAASNTAYLVNRGEVDSEGNATPGFDCHMQTSSRWIQAVAVSDVFPDPHGALDVFEATGNRFNGVLNGMRINLGQEANGKKEPWLFSRDDDTETTYEGMPGNERGYGFDFADFTDDGLFDAVQTSRGYNYLVTGILGPADHRDLIEDSVGLPDAETSNRRGRLKPRGAEDGVFADFDGDGQLELLVAGQRRGSNSWPYATGEPTPDSMIIKYTDHKATGEFRQSSQDLSVVYDATIDVGLRENGSFEDLPNNADRAVAGDLDNDGDIDAIVHLMPIRKDPSDVGFEFPHIGPPNFDPIDHYTFGWRYLQNGTDPSSGGLDFTDVAPTHMKEEGAPSGEPYRAYWNRALGMDVLADFDNNGALDLFTTNGKQQRVGEETIQSLEQTRDLLFMNGWVGEPVGTLLEVTGASEVAGILPAPCVPIIDDVSDPFDSCGSFGVAQGDIDGDGDADLVVTRATDELVNYPSLLINSLTGSDAPGGRGQFENEYCERVPCQEVDEAIHVKAVDLINPSNPAEPTSAVMEAAMFPAFLDFDGDGDLDLILAQRGNVHRILRNRGRDTNGDGYVNASDDDQSSKVGYFEDVTSAVIARIKPTTDSHDIQVIDIDGDGDLDFINESYNDEVTFWRNERNPRGNRPIVTEIWPRVGSIGGSQIVLHGVNLDDVDRVELRYKGHTETVLASAFDLPMSTSTKLVVTLPSELTRGLAQVRVRRFIEGRGGVFSTKWSKQYIGYFVLGTDSE